MVDVGAKPASRAARRCARAACRWPPQTASRLRELPKGDALATAQLAGIMAAKRTSELIPLCHPLPLSHVAVSLDGRRRTASRSSLRPRRPRRPASRWRRSRAASVAALTVYDMAKAIDKQMRFTGRAGREDESVMRAAVLTVSDRVSRGEATDESGDLLESLLRADAHEVARQRRSRRGRRDRRRDRGSGGAVAARPHDRRHGSRAARRHAGGDAHGPAARGAGHRGGAARGFDREDAARPALSRRRGRDRAHARRQPAGLARRLPRRLRHPAPGTRPCGRRCLRTTPHDTARPRYKDRMRVARLYYRLVKFEHTIFALPVRLRRRLPRSRRRADARTTCSGSRSRWSARARSRWR